MRLFSHRKRSAAAGPLPTERLPRRASTEVSHPLPPAPREATAPGPWCYAEVVGPIADVFRACRHATQASSEAPMPSLQAAVDNLKGYAFFLDADMVGDLCRATGGLARLPHRGPHARPRGPCRPSQADPTRRAGLRLDCWIAASSGRHESDGGRHSPDPLHRNAGSRGDGTYHRGKRRGPSPRSARSGLGRGRQGRTHESIAAERLWAGGGHHQLRSPGRSGTRASFASRERQNPVRV